MIISYDDSKDNQEFALSRHISVPILTEKRNNHFPLFLLNCCGSQKGKALDV